MPGRGDNRIHKHDLVDFLIKNGMPIHEDLLASKILIYTEPERLNQVLKTLAKNLRQESWDPIFVIDPFLLGYLIAKSSIAAVVMTNPKNLEGIAKILSHAEKTQSNPTKMILLSKETYQAQFDVDILVARDASQVPRLIKQEQAA